LPVEHFNAAPAVLIFTTSLRPSLIMAVPACSLWNKYDISHKSPEVPVEHSSKVVRKERALIIIIINIIAKIGVTLSQ